MTAARTRRVVVYAGIGLSTDDEDSVGTGEDGLQPVHGVQAFMTHEAWQRDHTQVIPRYDALRRRFRQLKPNRAHQALATLQQQMGREACILVTDAVDHRLEQAGAVEVLSMHGSLFRLRCERSDAHPRVAVEGNQDSEQRCEVCHARLRPDVVWPGEELLFAQRIEQALSRCDIFMAAGASGVGYPVAGFMALAKRAGAICVEVNPTPSGGAFDRVVVARTQVALPQIVQAWSEHVNE